MVFNEMLDIIDSRWGFLLQDLNQRWLNRQNLKAFAEAVPRKGVFLDNVQGLIDKIVRVIYRSTTNQTIVYSRHKRKHGFKYQSISTPNGMTRTPLFTKFRTSLLICCPSLFFVIISTTSIHGAHKLQL